MEVDASVPPPAADAAATAPPSSVPLPLTEHLAKALSQQDYALALRVANDLEIAIQVLQKGSRERREGGVAWVVWEETLVVLES